MGDNYEHFTLSGADAKNEYGKIQRRISLGVISPKKSYVYPKLGKKSV